MENVLLDIENATKRFGGLTAVNSVNITVKEKTIHALIGPNGSGKSTLLNLINGIYSLNEGCINFNGTQTNKLSPHRIAHLGIARTFQNIRLFNHLTVLENVLVGQHFRNKSGFFPSVFGFPKSRKAEKWMVEKAEKALEIFNLSPMMVMKPDSLSYGQQRMLEIARALVMEPKIILLDEPAAGLNPAECDMLLSRIQKINHSGVTILLVEHNMKFVMEISENITVLDFGKVICEGRPEEVNCNERVIEAYLGDQKGLEFDVYRDEVAA